MALAGTTQKLLVQLGDGAGPEIFTAPCSFNTNREFTTEVSTIDFNVPDCSSPDAPSWVRRVADTFSAGVSGAGTLDLASYSVWRVWFLSGLPKNIRIKLDENLAAGGGYWAGSFLLTSIGLAKEGKGFATFSATMQSDGPLTWTAAAA